MWNIDIRSTLATLARRAGPTSEKRLPYLFGGGPGEEERTAHRPPARDRRCPTGSANGILALQIVQPSSRFGSCCVPSRTLWCQDVRLGKGFMKTAKMTGSACGRLRLTLLLTGVFAVIAGLSLFAGTPAAGHDLTRRDRIEAATTVMNKGGKPLPLSGALRPLDDRRQAQGRDFRAGIFAGRAARR